MYRDFLLACLLSITLHLGLLFGLPAPMWEPFVAQEMPRDVELVAMALPDPQALNADASVADLTPAPQPPPPPPSALTFDDSRIAPISREQIDAAVAQADKGASASQKMSALELPAPTTSDLLPPLESPPPVEVSEPVDPSTVVAALLDASPSDPGQPQGKAHAVGLGKLLLGEKQTPKGLVSPKLDPKLLAPPPPQAEAVVTLPIPEPELGIEGPAARRETLSRPPLPEVVVVRDSEITLKFWVRPDGVVSRIVTVRKDNTALEAAAIRYVSGWRFSPLRPHDVQEEQWGTITVRFLRPTR